MTADREAVIDLIVRGNRGETEVRAVVDTGCSGSIALPETVAISLGMTYLGPREAQLADDTIVQMEEYAGLVVWDGEPRLVAVLATADTVLAGMDLFYGYDIQMRVLDGGPVTFTRVGSGEVGGSGS